MVGIIVEEQLLPIAAHHFGASEKWKNAQSTALIANMYKKGRFMDGQRGVMSGISEFIRNIRSDEVGSNATIEDFQALKERCKILSLKWRSRRVLTSIFSDGTIAHITLKNLQTQEVLIHVDKSLRHNDVITNVSYAHRIVVFLLEDNRLLVARTFELPNAEAGAGSGDLVQPDVIIDMYPEFLPHLASRRANKRMSINDRSDKFVVWWTASKDDVFPWSPKPEDRANILVYELHQNEAPTLLSYFKTDHKLIDASFVPHYDQFCTLEEEVDPQGNIVMVEIFYDIFTMSRLNETAIPLQSGITCFAYDMKMSRLALGCCDSSIVVYSQAGRVTMFTKTPFIPVAVSWHPDSYLVFVAGEGGRYQLFDIALTPVLLVQAGASNPTVTKEFLSCGPVKDLLWSPWPSASCDSNLLLHFESGPMIILRFAVGQMGLAPLVELYVGNGETSEAIKVLKSVYWNSQDCLTAMFNIYGSLIRQNHTDPIEFALEALLAIYFVPTYGGDDIIRKKHSKSMRILARRFFMWLLRASKFQRALQVATSLGESGLFQKLHHVASVKGDEATAAAAMSLLSASAPSSSGSSSSSSSYGESSVTGSTDSETCSSCSSSTGSVRGDVEESSSSSSETDPEAEEEILRGHQVLVSDVSPLPLSNTLRVLPLEVPYPISTIQEEAEAELTEVTIAPTPAAPSSKPSTTSQIITVANSRLFGGTDGEKSDIQVVDFGLV